MPVPLIAPFDFYKLRNFTIEGNVAAVKTVGDYWKKFGGACDAASNGMQDLDVASFLGDEADQFKELLNEDIPSMLDDYGDAHTAIGDAIISYSESLSTALTNIRTLRNAAQRHHGQLETAIVDYNSTETAYFSAIMTADPVLIATTKLAFEKAEVQYAAKLSQWQDDLQKSEDIKDTLGVETQELVQLITSQVLSVVDYRPFEISAAAASALAELAAEGIFDLLSSLSTGLVNVVHELQELSQFGVGEFLKLTEKLGEAAFGGIQKRVQESLVELYMHSAEEVKELLSRGQRQAEVAEPVDAATGVLVESVVDVSIGGILPLTVSRRYSSLFGISKVGGAFGLGWMSSLDCCLEVFDDQVVMVAPDGAVVYFDAPTVDGSEVRGAGREWLLSFVDGAYRVRDVASGVVYVFAAGGLTALHKPDSPMSDDEFGVITAEGEVLQQNWDEHSVRPTGFGRSSSTVAASLGQGIELGLSLVVHRSGMWIEYVRDQMTGCIAQLVRSDGTVVEVGWDHQLNRVTELKVTHRNQQELGADDGHERGNGELRDDSVVDELKLDCGGLCVGFDYDQAGLLRKVVDPISSQVKLTYEYNDRSLLSGWVDSNGVGYWHIYDDAGRVVAQAGSGGVYANAFVWLEDTAPDAPVGGRLCVMIETATVSEIDMLKADHAVAVDRLARLQQLPLVQALRAGGLQGAGLIGCGRDGDRTTAFNTGDAVGGLEEWLYDEVLGDIRASVWRSTAAGDVWRVVSATGLATDYVYNDCHQVIGIIGANNGVLEFIRDETGQVIETLYPDGSGTRVETGAWGQPVKVTNSAGLSVEYELDSVGNVTSITDAMGRVTQIEYQWFVSGVVPWKVISPEGLVTTFECDSAGRVTSVENEQGLRWSVTRNVMGYVEEAMNPLGEITRVRYSSQGYPVEVVAPDGSAQVAQYDTEGNLVSVVNETGAVATTAYTVFDKPLEVIDAAGGVTRMVYNTQLQVVGVVNADGHRWDYQYDLDGRLIMESDYNELVTRYEYDRARNITKMIDPVGGVNTIYADNTGRTIRTMDSSGKETRYSYAQQGWLESISQPDATINYVRDDFGRLEAECIKLATGEVITARAERGLTGRTTATVMDVAGHVIRQQYNYHKVSQDLTEISVFHNTSALTTVAASLSTSDAAVDALAGLGLVGSIDVGVDDLKRRNHFGIGVVDRMLEFDAKGRLTADITAAVDPKHADGFTVVAGRQFTWRPDDVLIGIDDALAGSSLFDVDVLGRVTNIHHDRTTVDQANPDGYRLNAVKGHATSSHLKNTSFGSAGRDVFATEQYSYSAAGQLQSVVSPDYAQYDEMSPRSRAEVESGYEATTTYNRVMKNTLVTRVGKTSYVYDGLGRVIRSVTKRLSRKPLIKHYQYAASTGQVTRYRSSDHPNLVWDYTYDGLGRRVAKTCTDTTSNALVVKVIFGHFGNQMIAEHYLYGCDHDGTIARAWIVDPKTNNTIAQLTTAHTSNNHITIKDSIYPNHGSKIFNNAQAEKLHWAQQPITVQLHAVVTDLAGAPKEIIDTTTGNIIGRSTQTLYGQRNWKGTTTCPLLFTGQYHDTESNLVYNRYRYYDPVAGIYTSQDPLGQTPNIATPQGYTKNPTIWIDPLGLRACPRIPKTGDNDGGPGTWQPTNEKFNEGPITFQENVTGINREWGYVVPSGDGVVKFDGWSDDTLIDAKGALPFLTDPSGEDLPKWFTESKGDKKIIEQAKRQLAAIDKQENVRVQWIVEDEMTYNTYMNILGPERAAKVHLTLYDPRKHNVLKPDSVG